MYLFQLDLIHLIICPMGMRYVSIQQTIRFSISKISNIGCATPSWTVLVSWYHDYVTIVSGRPYWHIWLENLKSKNTSLTYTNKCQQIWEMQFYICQQYKCITMCINMNIMVLYIIIFINFEDASLVVLKMSVKAW